MKDELIFGDIAPYLPHGLQLYYEPKGEIINVRPSHFPNDWSVTFVSKPILRPLLALTKEIEHNGEVFVPIKVLEKDYSGFYFASNLEVLFKSKNTNLYISMNWPLQILNKLYEWHFDVNGLIDRGLAIDINTLKS